MAHALAEIGHTSPLTTAGDTLTGRDSGDVVADLGSEAELGMSVVALLTMPGASLWDDISVHFRYAVTKKSALTQPRLRTCPDRMPVSTPRVGTTPAILRFPCESNRVAILSSATMVSNPPWSGPRRFDLLSGMSDFASGPVRRGRVNWRARLLVIFQVLTPKDRLRSRARVHRIVDQSCPRSVGRSGPPGRWAGTGSSVPGIVAVRQAFAGARPEETTRSAPRAGGGAGPGGVRDAGGRQRLGLGDLAVVGRDIAGGPGADRGAA
jgi:hypothetical protein